jgi:flavin reductase (DIM6/NTAB) family NADH-FMN oxidoreductase RutF
MSEVVGPIPDSREPDAYDRQRRRVLWSLPSGLYVIGSHGDHEGEQRWNLMTANQVVQVSTDPKIVAVGIDAQALTAVLIRQGRSFSVSLLQREDRALVRRFVKPATEVEVEGDRAVRISGEPVTVALTGAPIVAAAAAWLDCALVQEVVLGSHVLFLGEVVDVGGRVDETDVAPILRMEDTRMNYGG